MAKYMLWAGRLFGRLYIIHSGGIHPRRLAVFCFSSVEAADEVGSGEGAPGILKYSDILFLKPAFHSSVLYSNSSLFPDIWSEVLRLERDNASALPVPYYTQL